MGLIRFLLACIVVLCHTSQIFGYQPIPSNLAVQCFYVISGFYMTLILNEKYIKGANKLFYTNRALKLYPIYWVVLVLLVGYSIFAYHKGYWSTLRSYNLASPLSISTWLFLIIVNILILGLDLTFILGINKGNLYLTNDYRQSKPNVYNLAFNSIGWTLGLEALFYAIAPFILRRHPFIIFSILFFSLCLRVLLVSYGFSGHPWDYMFFPTQIMFFMGGCLSYHLYLRLKDYSFNRFFLRSQHIILFIIIFFYDYFFAESYCKQSALFILIVLLMPASFLVSKTSKIDRYLGNLSYPIYVSQMFVINITLAKSFPKIGGLGFTSLVIVILISIILDYVISRPIERYRQKRVMSYSSKG